ncbi:hypothetical protein F5Y14DRAFT_403779 [Nemania sp. NC0429]|nr:hypothetical protein F5Y14DRAFT_403779 [Nemania sp. NC0429]
MMVSYGEIQASNARISDATAPQVAVFVGATSGIGNITVKALVATGASVRIYLVGRKSSKERIGTFIKELHAINPNAEVIWTEGEVALLAETKRVCETIQEKESQVDLLFLSAGYAPFDGRSETTEGLDIAQSLEYYSRILFIQALLPQLKQSKAPRVISVLGGGQERTNIDVDDLELKKPGSLHGARAQILYTAMNTVALEKLATDNPSVTFLHSYPGWVNTGNVRRGIDMSSPWGIFVSIFLGPLIGLVGSGDEEAGQRFLFQCTSAAFGGRGVPWAGKPGVNSLEKQANGLYLVNSKCNCTPNAKVVSTLREKASTKIWDHTQEIVGRYL